MSNKILVPTDGSERAERAADFAIKMAGDSGASLVFLYVLDEAAPAYAFEIESGVTPDVVELSDRMKEAASGFVDRLKERADAAGITAEALVETGHPWKEILAVAERSGADHIVMSSHGRRALAAAVIGSVTVNVLHGAKVPVTIVPE